MSGLQLEKVIKRYGQTQVIHGVDLQIAEVINAPIELCRTCADQFTTLADNGHTNESDRASCERLSWC